MKGARLPLADDVVAVPATLDLQTVIVQTATPKTMPVNSVLEGLCIHGNRSEAARALPARHQRIARSRIPSNIVAVKPTSWANSIAASCSIRSALQRPSTCDAQSTLLARQNARPRRAHGDYAFFFCDLDGNWWEIVAVRPGGYAADFGEEDRDLTGRHEFDDLRGSVTHIHTHDAEFRATLQTQR